LTIPELMLIVGTRATAGVRLGLLIAGKLNQDVRKGAGWALLAIGAFTSIPLMINVIGREHTLKTEQKRAA
jgi:hypothetical protein